MHEDFERLQGNVLSDINLSEVSEGTESYLSNLYIGSVNTI